MLNKSYFYLRMVILVFFLFMLNGALSQNIKAPATSNSILMGNSNLKSGIYALLVGINKYKGLDNLKYAEKDVRDFAIFLNEVFNENLKLDTLTNTEAKLDKIITSIGLAQNQNFGELKKAYLLFSVHGGLNNVNDKEVYLFVNENQYPNDNVGKGLLKMKYLKNLVDLFTNEGVMVILILDACHAGNINPQKIHQTINSWNNDKISVKFLACLEDEKAHESDSLQNGILTHYFLKGARSEANSDANDTIDVNEMRNYLIRKVADEALKINKKQTPLIIGKDSLIIAVLNKKDKIQPLKAIYTDTESAVKTDSLKNIEDSFKKSLENEDLNGAFNWLMRYKAHDSVSLSYHQLKYKYISTCYNVSVDLSEKLVGLTLNSFTQVKNSALFKSTDIFTHATVSNRSGVIENLKKCLTLLKITEPFYEEINYRLLIIEGYKQKDIKKIDSAIQINPDFAYPYLFLAYINCKNENYADCIKDLGKYKTLSGDEKVIDEVISSIYLLQNEEKKEDNKLMAVYVKDTVTRYLTGSLKMGDEHISSLYTTPTITLLFINDLFDRDEKELGTLDFTADKIMISENFYLNQQSIPARKKRELLEEIFAKSKISLFSNPYFNQEFIRTTDDLKWSDTTFSIDNEKRILGIDKFPTSRNKSKSWKIGDGTHLSINDSLGNAILNTLLKNDVPATTMKVWCDAKAVLQKSRDLFTSYELATSKDPKKKLMYQELLKQNFILVVGFSNVHEVHENIYEKDDKGRTIQVIRKPTGKYTCDVRSFLYKIDMTSATISNLASNCDTRKIPIKYIDRFYLQDFAMGVKHYTINRRKFQNGSFVVVPEEVYLTEKEFNYYAIQNATNYILEQLAMQIEEFKMRSGVTQVKPFYASELGEKQSVYKDQRYDVYRYEKDVEKNEVNAAKIATVRITKIAKNKTYQFTSSSKLGHISSLASFSLFKEDNKSIDTTNNSSQKSNITLSSDSLHKWSHFRPISVGNIEKGDFLLQSDDIGISLLSGYNYNNLFPSLILGLELKLNILLKSRSFPSGFKLGAWVNLINNDYKFISSNEGKINEKYSKLYFTIYATKDFYLSRIIDVNPFLAFEFAGGGKGFRFGTQIPINVYSGKIKISPNVSLQTLSTKQGILRPCFGVLTKIDF